MSMTDIRSALVQAYEDGAFSIPTAWENVSYSPVSGTAWAQVTLLPSEPSVGSLGDGGIDIHRGIMQIDLFYPRGGGDVPSNNKAQAIRAYFYAGRSFVYGGQSVTIMQSGRGPATVTEDGWFQMPVSVHYYARTRR